MVKVRLANAFSSNMNINQDILPNPGEIYIFQRKFNIFGDKMLSSL